MLISIRLELDGGAETVPSDVVDREIEGTMTDGGEADEGGMTTEDCWEGCGGEEGTAEPESAGLLEIGASLGKGRGVLVGTGAG